MFERFTQEARAVVVDAQVEARALGHGWIGTEHMLLAAAAADRGVAPRVLAGAGITPELLRRELGGMPPAGIDAAALASIGIDLDAIRQRVEATFGIGALERRKVCNDGSIPFRPEAKRALELSLREARSLDSDHIGTEHVLLGLAHGPSPAQETLERHGLCYERLRARVLEALAA